MEKLIHILDLDGCVINVDIEPWIILKEKPNEPILRLRAGERKLLESNVFKGDNNLITYSGKNYWISNIMYETLEKKTKVGIDISSFGVSYAEYFDPLLVSEQADKFKVLISNIEHIKNTNDDVIIMSERSGLELHSNLIDSVRTELSNLNIIASNFYLLSDNNINTNLEDIALSKSLLALEKMIGYKISDSKFTNIEIDQYNKVHIYDDSREVYEELKTLQETFNKVYYNSDDNMKSIIMDMVLKNKPFIKIHLITGNDFNRFKTNTIILNRPTRLHKFNFFK